MTAASTAEAPASETPDAGRPGRSRSRWRKHAAGLGLAAPWTILFLIFMLFPIVASLAMSFTDFGAKDLRNPIGTNIVGFDNYTTAFADPEVRTAAVNTAYFVLAGVPLTIVAGLAVAVALNSTVVKMRTLFRVGYYTPVVTSIVAIAVIWRFVLHPDFGLLNTVLAWFGIEGPNYLADETLAMPAIIAIAVWRNVGFTMIIFLAGLQGIPTTLQEAAMIDGASRWQRFRSITLPLLRPTTLFAVVITGIGYLQLFEEPFVMTAGGPLDSTLSIVMVVYEEGFNFLNLGYAAAIAYALFVAIVVLTVLQFRFLRPQA